MIKDVTFGQYVAGNSLIHRLDARTKLALAVAYIVMLFLAKTFVGLAAAFLTVFLLYFIAQVPVRMLLRSLKPVLPLIIFTAVLNMFFVSGDPLISWKFINISKQGVFFAIVLSVRIICLLAASTLLTYTTSPLELTDALERIMKPLGKLGFPAHELAMMMTIALRFIPTLIEETDRIMSAQKSRGAQLDTGGLKEKVKAMVPILVPLFVSAFRRADELALAMECRCYHGGEGRTRLNVTRFHLRDAVSALLIAALFAGVILCNSSFTAVIK